MFYFIPYTTFFIILDFSMDEVSCIINFDCIQKWTANMSETQSLTNVSEPHNAKWRGQCSRCLQIRIRNEELRRRADITVVIDRTARLKWNLVGRVAWMEDVPKG